MRVWGAWGKRGQERSGMPLVHHRMFRLSHQRKGKWIANCLRCPGLKPTLLQEREFLNADWCGLLAEKAMAPHSSTLAWKIPWTEEPDRLQSMGSQRVGYDWTTSLSLFTFTFMHRRRRWQPTPVFLPGESQGQGSLVGCRLWGRTESDTTEAT